MRRLSSNFFALVLALGLTASAGCSSSTKPGTDSAVPADTGQDLGPADGGAPDAGLLPFGFPCAAAQECQTGICFMFGDGTRHCSQTCNDAGTGEDCPEGSMGRKCNGRGYCAY